MSTKPSMPMRVLGNTGLQTSVLGMGFWATYGAKPDLLDNQEGIDKAKACMRVARAGGVNLFDNAETYGEPRGTAELIMGEALRQLREEDPKSWRRSDLIITTKIFWGGSGVNEMGLSRKHVREGMDASLERLQLAYVDLVFAHRPDPLTPTETVVRAMNDLIRNGKATAYGCSEWSAQQITEAYWIAQTHGLEPPSFEQPQYNMFTREKVEAEFAPLYLPPYNLGLTTWSPLAGGLLTGKYNEGIPPGSRLASSDYKAFHDPEAWRASGKLDAVKKLGSFAKDKLDCSMAQLAVAWILKNKRVTTTLLGASKPAQLEHTLGALAVAERMTDDDMATIEAILGSQPDAFVGYGAAMLPEAAPPDGRRAQPTW